MFHVVDMNKKIDNLLKFVMDALALVVYSNQSKVMGVTMRKIPAEINEEWTIISVEEEAIWFLRIEKWLHSCIDTYRRKLDLKF